MHITIIANGFQEDYMEQLLNNMAGLVERIDFIGSSIHHDRPRPQNVTYYNLRGGHEENVPVWAKVMRIARYHFNLTRYLLNTRSRVVHVQWVRFPVLEGIVFTLFMRFLGKKVIYTAHDVLPHSGDTWYNRTLYRGVYCLQNQIIAHTNYIKQRILNEFSIRDQKVHVVPHGVYERPFDASLSPRMARERLHLMTDSFVLLFFGFIAEYKGLDLLLESMKQYAGIPKIQLLIAGRVSPGYKAAFNRLVEDPAIRDNLVLHIRFIRDEEIETLFKAAHVAVLPYREASQSGVLFMSYAYGVPVLVPDLGGFPDDVIPEKTGFIFDRENTVSLTQTLEKISRDPSVMTGSCSETIRSHALTHYAWQRSCALMTEVYRRD